MVGCLGTSRGHLGGPWSTPGYATAPFESEPALKGLVQPRSRWQALADLVARRRPQELLRKTGDPIRRRIRLPVSPSISAKFSGVRQDAGFVKAPSSGRVAKFPSLLRRLRPRGTAEARTSRTPAPVASCYRSTTRTSPPPRRGGTSAGRSTSGSRCHRPGSHPGRWRPRRACTRLRRSPGCHSGCSSGWCRSRSR